ncbi:MAG: molybdopterin-dependent oxidoreductase, partial [Lachnospiraceae bacterium]|nr:molybdopterin-dependent oxidoreductase [Lachnospiraceae bacterium]
NGFGPDHYTNGHSAVFANCVLAILTGNVGKPGASAGLQMPLGFYFNGAMSAPEGAKPAGRTVPYVVFPEVMETKTFMGQPMDIRSLYVWCGNPVGNMTDRQAILDAFEKMDMVVVADLTMTDTAQYADIVLPVSHWFEIEDIHGMVSQVPYLMLQEKAMDPLYESKSDLEIINLLGNAMGFEGTFDVTAEEWMKTALDSPYAQMLGISYDRLKEEKILRYLPSDPYIYGENGFPTATGRAQFYDENPAPNTYIGQTIDVELERLPYWEPPTEAWTGTDLAKKYPLIFGQLRPKYRVHTQWSTSEWMKELDPEPVLMINSVDAEPRGIKNGDMVKAYNDRGYVIIKAVINEGARPGMIIIPKGWQKGQFVEGHYSDLSSRAFNPASLNNCFYDARIEVEKI